MNLNSLMNGDITQEEFMNYHNASLSYEPLPRRINGFVFKHDGICFVIINKYLSQIMQAKAALHEFAHVELDHLYNYDKDLFAFNVINYEYEADNYIKFLGDIK